MAQVKPKILVVDDTPNILEVIKLFLEKEGYEVATFRHPKEALQNATRNPYSLFILDIMMPGCDGFTMTKILKNHSGTRNVPIILLSARGILLETPKDIKYKIYGFIPKPFSKDLLVKIVERSIMTAYEGEVQPNNS